MAVHAGRTSEKDKVGYSTMGCIRVSEKTMEAIGETIKNYGPMETITVTNNFSRKGNGYVSKPFINQKKTTQTQL